MFVLAVMHFAGGSTPVKIRDMSSKGALIEAPMLPPPGNAIRLCRSNLSLQGKVVWVRGSRAGLLFEQVASVGDWLPGKTPPGQRTSDELFHQKRVSARVDIPVAAAPTIVEPAAATASDLLELQRAIEALAGDLADDPEVVVRHGHKLQTLDLASQTIGKLAQRLRAGSR